MDLQYQILPAEFLYTGVAGEIYGEMARDHAYARLRGLVPKPRIQAALSTVDVSSVLLLGVGDGFSEAALLGPLPLIPTMVLHDVKGQHRVATELTSCAQRLATVSFDLEEMDHVRAEPRRGNRLMTLLGYTIGNLLVPEVFLRNAARLGDVLVVDVPLAGPGDLRLRGEAWSHVEARWLDAAQRAYRLLGHPDLAAWPIRSHVAHFPDGYLIRLVAEGPDGERLELLRFRRHTVDGWVRLFERGGWTPVAVDAVPNPPRATFLLEARPLECAATSSPGGTRTPSSPSGAGTGGPSSGRARPCASPSAAP